MDKSISKSYIMLACTIMLIPIFWMLGVKFLFFQICALTLLVLNIKNNKIIDLIKECKSIKLFSACIIAFMLCNIIAIFINPLGLEKSEFISSFYHLSYWGAGIILTIFFAANDEGDVSNLKVIKKAIYILAILQVVVFVISIIEWNFGDIWSEKHGFVYSIFPVMSTNTFLSEVTSINLSYVDWVNDIYKYRFNGFYMYPATAGITTLYLLCYCDDLKLFKDKINKIIKYIVIATLIITIYLTKSRMVYLSIVLGLAITICILCINKKNIKYVFITGATLLGISIIFIISFDIINKVILSRPESSIDRFATYLYGIKTALKFPLFGVGDKFSVEGIYLLIGSHSTYINILVKSGFLGLLFILIALGIVFVKIFKNKKSIGCIKSRNLWFVSSFLFITTTIWMFTEEIDWPSITAFFFFMNIGLIFSFEKIVRKMNEKSYENMKVCFVTSSGGHLTHLMQLKDWWIDKKRFWVTFKKIDAESALEGEKIYWCYYPTNRNIKNLIKNLFLAIKVIYKERPEVIISTGAAPAIPFFYVGKVFGVRLIYIEVYDRIDLATMTGKIVYPITDEFIIQWEEQRKHYKESKLLGGLF